MGSLLLVVVGACGGKVVVESTGATGAGGAGGAATTDTGNGGFIASTGDVSPVGVVSSVAVTTGGASTCEQVCNQQQAKGCDTSSCLSDCQQAYASAGMCTPKLDAVASCYLNSSDPSCSPKACDGLVQSYSSCIDPNTCGTSPTSCSVGNDGSCDCQADCNGSKLEAQCVPKNATDFCVCLENGMIIDKCLQPQGSGLSCDIVKGCCAKAFFPAP